MINKDFDYFLRQNTKMFNIIERGYMKDMVKNPSDISLLSWKATMNLKSRLQSIENYIYNNLDKIGIEEIIAFAKMEYKHRDRLNRILDLFDNKSEENKCMNIH